MEQNKLSGHTPRKTLPQFEAWLNAQGDAAELLSPMCYLYCVDGCGPDEVGQRFSMVAAKAQALGAGGERLAQWHKTHGELWEDDPARYREGVYAWERHRRTQYTSMQLMCEIQPKKAEYLIEPYLPKGMITVLGGVSGVGKTWLALHWAAQVSRSLALDDPGAVYYFTQENDPAIVLQPRLQALGADTTHILVEKIDAASPTMTLDDTRLRVAAEFLRPKLVVFDPIQSYLGARVEMNKANEVRPILDWLGRFAQEYNCAVVLVSHMAKPSATNGEALDRLLGSSDFRNAARSIVIVGRDPDAPDVRVFAHAKNSIGQPGPSWRYRVGDGGVEMLGTCDLTANEIIKVGAKTVGRPAKSLEAATEALKELMGEKGWTSLDEIKRLCDETGISMATLQRAKKDLHVQLRRDGRRSWWLMPGSPSEGVQTAI